MNLSYLIIGIIRSSFVLIHKNATNAIEQVQKIFALFEQCFPHIKAPVLCEIQYEGETDIKTWIENNLSPFNYWGESDKTLIWDYPAPTPEFLESIWGIIHTLGNPKPRLLNKGRGENTYGEVEYSSILELLELVKFSKNECFLDLGSGVGHILFQLGLSNSFSQLVGIENSKLCLDTFNNLLEQYKILTNFFALNCPYPTTYNANIRDFISYVSMQRSKVILFNNITFDPTTNEFMERAIPTLNNGVFLLTPTRFFNNRNSHRGKSKRHVNSIINHLRLIGEVQCNVSWSCKNIPLFIYVTINSLTCGTDKKTDADLWNLFLRLRPELKRQYPHINGPPANYIIQVLTT